MRKLHALTLACLLAPLLVARAQDEEAATEEPSGGLTISGSVDTYVRGIIGAERDWAPPTAFANKNGVALGMVNLVIAKEGEKAGFVADLVYGPRGADAVFLSVGSASIVNQLYAYWKVNDALRLTLGNFNTFLGYEVISPVGNFHYTTSYMFSYGPFSHTGLRADLAITEQFSAMLAVMNPTDFTEFNPASTYTLGAQLGYVADAGSAFLNVVYGDQDGAVNRNKELVKTTILGGDTAISSKPQFQIDLSTGWNLTDAFYLGLNTSYNIVTGAKLYAASIDGASIEETTSGVTNGYWGIALYPRYTVTDVFALGLRGEYFSEFEGGFGVIGAYDPSGSADVLALTLSGNIKAGDLTLIPEIRMDHYSRKVVPDKVGAGNMGVSALLAAVYAF